MYFLIFIYFTSKTNIFLIFFLNIFFDFFLIFSFKIFF